MRGYKRRYYNKWERYTFLKPRAFSGCRRIYYKIKYKIKSFLSDILSYILALILVYSVLMIGAIFLGALGALYDPVVDTASPNPVVDTASPNHVLNIVGADGNRIILANNESAADPSYEELRIFLKADSTDMIPYDYDSFVCADFAEAVHNNAEKSGIKAGYVGIDFYEINDGHACNVFNTTDRGLIFIDCTNNLKGIGPSYKDHIVTVEEGSTYHPKYLFSNERWQTFPMGTVKSYEIFW